MCRRLVEWLAEAGSGQAERVHGSTELRHAPRVCEPTIVVYVQDGAAPSGRRLRKRMIARPPANTTRLPDRGQALTEFILVLPLVLLLVVNTVNFGAFFFAWITVANASRAGAQYWALGDAGTGAPASPTAGQVTALITTDISSLLNRASLSVRTCTNNNGTVSCTGTGSYTPPSDPESPNYVLASVDVTYTYQPPIPLWNFPGVSVYATLPSTTVHRRTIMRRLQ